MIVASSSRDFSEKERSSKTARAGAKQRAAVINILDFLLEILPILIHH